MGRWAALLIDNNKKYEALNKEKSAILFLVITTQLLDKSVKVPFYFFGSNLTMFNFFLSLLLSFYFSYKPCEMNWDSL
jgi:hypothetical protein